MKTIKNYTILLFFLFIVSCGYSPLVENQKNNISIIEVTFEGDRKINNYISDQLKKVSSNNDNSTNYIIKVSSEYKKNIVNKDSKGNPKNFNLTIITKLIIQSSKSDEIEKTFEKSIPLKSKQKKITEKKLEEKYKENLSKTIAKEIIFYLNSL